MSKNKRLTRLFFSMLHISACTFGGGYVIVPMMQRKFVQELGWLGNDEMTDLTVIAQSTPGAIAVNAAILVGYRTSGLIGAAIAALGTALPPLLILSAISFFYSSFMNNTYVRLIMSGMQAGASAVICSLSVNLFLDIKNTRRKIHLAALTAVFIAILFCGANIAVILFCCALYGILDSRIIRAREIRNDSD